MNKRMLEGDINPADRVAIRIPFELPYPVYEQQVELDARVKNGGDTYSFTSHSYADNTLTLVGVRDQWAIHVDAVMSAFNRAANGDIDPDGIIHGITGLFQAFVADDPTNIVQFDTWVRLLNLRAPADFFPAIDLPVIPEPPCA